MPGTRSRNKRLGHRQRSGRQRTSKQGSPKSRRPALYFLAIFVLVNLTLFLIYWVTETTQQFRHVNEFNAWITSVLLSWLGIDNVRHGVQVRFEEGGGFGIISECSGIYVAILFTAGVLAFPASWAARWRGLVVGLIAIIVINAIRLVTLGAIHFHWSAAAPLFHEYLWQVFFVLVVAALYFVWIERLVPRWSA